MVGTAGTNVALRTTVMIGALVVLLLTALLPGPIGWLAGAGQPSEAVGESPVEDQRALADAGAAVAGGQPGNFSPGVEPHSVPVGGTLPGAGTADRATESMVVGVPTAASSEERCRQLRQRLRQLGAAYTRLESWEDKPLVYRFHCTLPLGEPAAGSLDEFRTFQASSPTAEEAMKRVLADVQAWQAGRERTFR